MRRVLRATLLACAAAAGAAVVGALVGVVIVRACSVPVFRYALERWEPDLYEITVFHRGPLSRAGIAALENLAARSVRTFSDIKLKSADGADELGQFSNVWLRTVDLDKEEPKAKKEAKAREEAEARKAREETEAGDPAKARESREARKARRERQARESVLKLWESEKSDEAKKAPALPWVTLRYPRYFPERRAIWSGPLDEGTAGLILDSPARRELSRRILKEECGVYVLLETGEAAKDDATARLIATVIEEMSKVLELPEADPWDYGVEDPEDVPELKVAFSIVRVKRDDPAEAAFRAMLLRSEPDLTELWEKGEPMVFAVFGRGRALPALVGKGINEDNIADVCAFLVGPCSCVVKQQNPGVDLVMSVDWVGVLAGELLIEEHLPPLVGVAAMAKAAAGLEAGGEAESVATRPAATGPGATKPAPTPKAAKVTDVAKAPAPADAPSVAGRGALVRNTIIAALLVALGVAAGTFVLRRRRS